MVWNERVQGNDTVTVQLGGRFNGIMVYDPTLGVAPVAARNGLQALRLTLSDHPLVIRIPPPIGRVRAR